MIVLAIPLFVSTIPLTIQELKAMVLGEALNDGKNLYLQVIDDTPWLAAQFNKWTVWFFGRSVTARQILALIILFVQASFFSFILIRNKAYNESNYLPALIFGLLSFFSFDMLSLSNELWASLILLLALNNLFKEIEFKVQRDEIVLNIGVYMGIASLFVFSYSIFLIGSLVILSIFARLDLRKAMLLIFGFLFPHSLVMALYFFRDGLPDAMSFYYGSNFTIHTLALVSWKSLLWLGSGLLIFFFLSMLMLSREARFTRYQSQLLQVVMIWLLIAIVEISITRERTPHSFITCIPPLAYFINHYLLLIRRRWLAETTLWLLIFSVVGISTAARMNEFEKVDYSKMFVKNESPNPDIRSKRIMVLSDHFEFYQNNRMASYFLNWDLSKNTFDLKRNYEDIVLINDSFQKDPPDVIIDEQDKMKKVFSRLPAFEKQYQRNGVLYERIK
ncbi:hypothetical protein WSM22_16090 [Cytophagales bacterium WSM2-2]|nr:hypothetical protein WSM22_16090 [Cytophagales bacterium WSM2-2]